MTQMAINHYCMDTPDVKYIYNRIFSLKRNTS